MRHTLTFAALLSSAVASQAAMTLSYEQTADNALWPSAPSGYTTSSIENITSYTGRIGYGFYDGFKIHAQGDANATVSSITLSFRFSGLFDDSVAIDLNGNGTIDYALPYWNIAAVSTNWYPWSSLQDATNLGIVLTIGVSGTTAQAYVYGTLIPVGGTGYYNSLSSITLASLGLASLDANGLATSTGSIRIGFTNVGGGSNGVPGGGGTPTLSPSNFGFDPNQTYAVPEPSTYGLALGGLALVGAVIRRRRNK